MSTVNPDNSGSKADSDRMPPPPSSSTSTSSHQQQTTTTTTTRRHHQEDDDATSSGVLSPTTPTGLTTRIVEALGHDLAVANSGSGFSSGGGFLPPDGNVSSVFISPLPGADDDDDGFIVEEGDGSRLATQPSLASYMRAPAGVAQTISSSSTYTTTSPPKTRSHPPHAASMTVEGGTTTMMMGSRSDTNTTFTSSSRNNSSIIGGANNSSSHHHQPPRHQNKRQETLASLRVAASGASVTGSMGTRPLSQPPPPPPPGNPHTRKPVVNNATSSTAISSSKQQQNQQQHNNINNNEGDAAMSSITAAASYLSVDGGASTTLVRTGSGVARRASNVSFHPINQPSNPPPSSSTSTAPPPPPTSSSTFPGGRYPTNPLPSPGENEEERDNLEDDATPMIAINNNNNEEDTRKQQTPKAESNRRKMSLSGVSLPSLFQFHSPNLAAPHLLRNSQFSLEVTRVSLFLRWLQLARTLAVQTTMNVHGGGSAADSSSFSSPPVATSASTTSSSSSVLTLERLLPPTALHPSSSSYMVVSSSTTPSSKRPSNNNRQSHQNVDNNNTTTTSIPLTETMWNPTDIADVLLSVARRVAPAETAAYLTSPAAPLPGSSPPPLALINVIFNKTTTNPENGREMKNNQESPSIEFQLIIRAVEVLMKDVYSYSLQPIVEAIVRPETGGSIGGGVETSSTSSAPFDNNGDSEVFGDSYSGGGPPLAPDGSSRRPSSTVHHHHHHYGAAGATIRVTLGKAIFKLLLELGEGGVIGVFHQKPSSTASTTDSTTSRAMATALIESKSLVTKQFTIVRKVYEKFQHQSGIASASTDTAAPSSSSGASILRMAVDRLTAGLKPYLVPTPTPAASINPSSSSTTNHRPSIHTSTPTATGLRLHSLISMSIVEGVNSNTNTPSSSINTGNPLTLKRKSSLVAAAARRKGSGAGHVGGVLGAQLHDVFYASHTKATLASSSAAQKQRRRPSISSAVVRVIDGDVDDYNGDRPSASYHPSSSRRRRRDRRQAELLMKKKQFITNVLLLVSWGLSLVLGVLCIILIATGHNATTPDTNTDDTNKSGLFSSAVVAVPIVLVLGGAVALGAYWWFYVRRSGNGGVSSLRPSYLEVDEGDGEDSTTASTGPYHPGPSPSTTIDHQSSPPITNNNNPNSNLAGILFTPASMADEFEDDGPNTNRNHARTGAARRGFTSPLDSPPPDEVEMTNSRQHHNPSSNDDNDDSAENDDEGDDYLSRIRIQYLAVLGAHLSNSITTISELRSQLGYLALAAALMEQQQRLEIELNAMNNNNNIVGGGDYNNSRRGSLVSATTNTTGTASAIPAFRRRSTNNSVDGLGGGSVQFNMVLSASSGILGSGGGLEGSTSDANYRSLHPFRSQIMGANTNNNNANYLDVTSGQQLEIDSSFVSALTVDENASLILGGSEGVGGGGGNNGTSSTITNTNTTTNGTTMQRRSLIIAPLDINAISGGTMTEGRGGGDEDGSGRGGQINNNDDRDGDAKNGMMPPDDTIDSDEHQQQQQWGVDLLGDGGSDLVTIHLDPTGTFVLPYSDNRHNNSIDDEDDIPPQSDPVLLDGRHVHQHVGIIGIEFIQSSSNVLDPNGFSKSSVFSGGDDEEEDSPAVRLDGSLLPLHSGASPMNISNKHQMNRQQQQQSGMFAQSYKNSDPQESTRYSICLWNDAISRYTGFSSDVTSSRTLTEVVGDDSSYMRLMTRISQLEEMVRVGATSPQIPEMKPIEVTFLQREVGTCLMSITVAPVLKSGVIVGVESGTWEMQGSGTGGGVEDAEDVCTGVLLIGVPVDPHSELAAIRLRHSYLCDVLTEMIGLTAMDADVGNNHHHAMMTEEGPQHPPTSPSSQQQQQHTYHNVPLSIANLLPSSLWEAHVSAPHPLSSGSSSKPPFPSHNNHNHPLRSVSASGCPSPVSWATDGRVHSICRTPLLPPLPHNPPSGPTGPMFVRQNMRTSFGDLAAARMAASHATSNSRVLPRRALSLALSVGSEHEIDSVTPRATSTTYRVSSFPGRTPPTNTPPSVTAVTPPQHRPQHEGDDDEDDDEGDSQIHANLAMQTFKPMDLSLRKSSTADTSHQNEDDNNQSTVDDEDDEDTVLFATRRRASFKSDNSPQLVRLVSDDAIALPPLPDAATTKPAGRSSPSPSRADDPLNLGSGGVGNRRTSRTRPPPMQMPATPPSTHAASASTGPALSSYLHPPTYHHLPVDGDGDGGDAFLDGTQPPYHQQHDHAKNILGIQRAAVNQFILFSVGSDLSLLAAMNFSRMTPVYASHLPLLVARGILKNASAALLGGSTISTNQFQPHHQNLMGGGGGVGGDANNLLFQVFLQGALLHFSTIVDGIHAACMKQQQHETKMKQQQHSSHNHTTQYHQQSNNVSATLQTDESVVIVSDGVDDDDDDLHAHQCHNEEHDYTSNNTTPNTADIIQWAEVALIEARNASLSSTPSTSNSFASGSGGGAKRSNLAQRLLAQVLTSPSLLPSQRHVYCATCLPQTIEMDIVGLTEMLSEMLFTVSIIAGVASKEAAEAEVSSQVCNLTTKINTTTTTTTPPASMNRRGTTTTKNSRPPTPSPPSSPPPPPPHSQPQSTSDSRPPMGIFITTIGDEDETNSVFACHVVGANPQVISALFGCLAAEAGRAGMEHDDGDEKGDEVTFNVDDKNQQDLADYAGGEENDDDDDDVTLQQKLSKQMVRDSRFLEALRDLSGYICCGGGVSLDQFDMSSSASPPSSSSPIGRNGGSTSSPFFNHPTTSTSSRPMSQMSDYASGAGGVSTSTAFDKATFFNAASQSAVVLSDFTVIIPVRSREHTDIKSGGTGSGGMPMPTTSASTAAPHFTNTSLAMNGSFNAFPLPPTSTTYGGGRGVSASSIWGSPAPRGGFGHTMMHTNANTNASRRSSVLLGSAGGLMSQSYDPSHNNNHLFQQQQNFGMAGCGCIALGGAGSAGTMLQHHHLLQNPNTSNELVNTSMVFNHRGGAGGGGGGLPMTRTSSAFGSTNNLLHQQGSMVFGSTPHLQHQGSAVYTTGDSSSVQSSLHKRRKAPLTPLNPRACLPSTTARHPSITNEFQEGGTSPRRVSAANRRQSQQRPSASESSASPILITPPPPPPPRRPMALTFIINERNDLDRHKLVRLLWGLQHAVFPVDGDSFFKDGLQMLRSGSRVFDAVILDYPTLPPSTTHDKRHGAIKGGHSHGHGSQSASAAAAIAAFEEAYEERIKRLAIEFSSTTFILRKERRSTPSSHKHGHRHRKKVLLPPPPQPSDKTTTNNNSKGSGARVVDVGSSTTKGIMGWAAPPGAAVVTVPSTTGGITTSSSKLSKITGKPILDSPPNYHVVEKAHSPNSLMELVNYTITSVDKIAEDARKKREVLDVLKVRCDTVWRRVRPLGKGTFGEVYEVELVLTGGHMAAKIVRIPTTSSDESFAAIASEIKILSRLDHPHIVRYFYCERGHERLEEGYRRYTGNVSSNSAPGCATTIPDSGIDDGDDDDEDEERWERDKNTLYIFMELCTGGTLQDRLNAHQHHAGRRRSAGGGGGARVASSGSSSGGGGGYSIAEVCTYMHQIISALSYIHGQNLVHRDLKPANVLLNNGKAKLADFGTAVSVVKGAPLRDTAGTFVYMAPEVFAGDEYGISCDVWSLGCVLIDLLGKTICKEVTGAPNPGMQIIARPSYSDNNNDDNDNKKKRDLTGFIFGGGYFSDLETDDEIQSRLNKIPGLWNPASTSTNHLQVPLSSTNYNTTCTTTKSSSASSNAMTLLNSLEEVVLKEWDVSFTDLVNYSNINHTDGSTNHHDVATNHHQVSEALRHNHLDTTQVATLFRIHDTVQELCDTELELKEDEGQSLVDFLSLCFRFDPSTRASAHSLLHHRLLTDIAPRRESHELLLQKVQESAVDLFPTLRSLLGNSGGVFGSILTSPNTPAATASTQQQQQYGDASSNDDLSISSGDGDDGFGDDLASDDIKDEGLQESDDHDDVDGDKDEFEEVLPQKASSGVFWRNGSPDLGPVPSNRASASNRSTGGSSTKSSTTTNNNVIRESTSGVFGVSGGGNAVVSSSSASLRPPLHNNKPTANPSSRSSRINNSSMMMSPDDLSVEARPPPQQQQIQSPTPSSSSSLRNQNNNNNMWNPRSSSIISTSGNNSGVFQSPSTPLRTTTQHPPMYSAPNPFRAPPPRALESPSRRLQKRNSMAASSSSYQQQQRVSGSGDVSSPSYGPMFAAPTPTSTSTSSSASPGHLQQQHQHVDVPPNNRPSTASSMPLEFRSGGTLSTNDKKNRDPPLAWSSRQ